MKPSDILKKHAKEVDTIISDEKNAKKFSFLLTDIPEIVQRRTRLGKGVLESGELYKLPSLSEGYEKKRAKLKLPPTTKPKKANMTLTGAMLESIKGIREKTRFIFNLEGSDSEGLSNSDKAIWNQMKGRRFFALSNSEKKGLQRKVEAVIRDLLRNIFKE